MGWFQDAQNAMYDILCAAFGKDPKAETSLKRFVPAYMPGIMNPEAGYDMNITYYAISERQMSGMDYLMQSNKENAIGIRRTVPISVMFYFYGPDADEESESFWAWIQCDTGEGSPRSLLRKARMVLAGRPARPMTAPEIAGTLWRRRCDLRVDINILLDEARKAQTIIEAPVIKIEKGAE